MLLRRVLFIFLLCVGLGQHRILNAGSFQGYWLDTKGDFVRSLSGECLKTGSWNRSTARPVCDNDLIELAKVDHELRSVLSEVEKLSPDVGEVIENALEQIDQIANKQYSEPSEAVKKIKQNSLSAGNHYCDQHYSSEKEDGVHEYDVAVSLIVGVCKSSDDIVAEAKTLLRESMDYGYAPAFNVWGYLLADGLFFGYSDIGYAQEFLIKAVELNDKDAQYNLGFIYEYGLGTVVDLDKSRGFYKKSGAKNGSLFRLKQHGESSGDTLDKGPNRHEDGKPEPRGSLARPNNAQEDSGLSGAPRGDMEGSGEKFKFPFIKY